MDRNGFSDPYVKMQIGKKTVKSKIIKKSLSPRWDEDFEFRGTLQELIAEPMQLSVWDYDFGSRNDRLGDGRVDLSQLEHELHLEASVKLHDQQARPGEVFLTFDFELDGVSSVSHRTDPPASAPSHHHPHHLPQHHLPPSPQRVYARQLLPTQLPPSPQPCASLPSPPSYGQPRPQYGGGRSYGTTYDCDRFQREAPGVPPHREVPVVPPRPPRDLPPMVSAWDHQKDQQHSKPERSHLLDRRGRVAATGLFYLLDVAFRASVTAAATSAVVAPELLSATGKDVWAGLSGLVANGVATGAAAVEVHVWQLRSRGNLWAHGR